MKVNTRIIYPNLSISDADGLHYHIKGSMRGALQSFLDDYASQYKEVLEAYDPVHRDFKNYKYLNVQATAEKLCDVIYQYVRRYIDRADIAPICRHLTFELVFITDKVHEVVLISNTDLKVDSAELKFKINVYGSDAHPFSDQLEGTINLVWDEEEYRECVVHTVSLHHDGCPDVYKIPYGLNESSAISSKVEGNIFTYTDKRKRKREVIAFTKYEEQIITEKTMRFSSFETKGFKEPPTTSEEE